MSAFEKNRSENMVPGQSAKSPEALAPKRTHLLKRIVNSAIAIADSRPVFYICLLIFPFAVLAYFPANFDDYDIWFHLTYGREHVQNLTWHIDHSQFSWTPAHQEWAYVTWLGSGILFLAHAAAGVIGLCLLQWLIFAGLMACLILYARSAGFRLNITILTALLVIFVTIKLLSNYIKPEMFTTLFFFAATAVYFHGKQTENKDFFWVFPLLFLVWVNTHGGFIAGLALLGIILGLETFARLVFPGQALPWPRFKRLALFAGLAGGATLINPYGIFYHLQVFGVWFADRFGVKEHYADIAAYESIWANMPLSEGKLFWFASGWSMVFMAISCAVLLLVYAIRKKRVPLAIVVLNLFFFLFSMSMGRGVIFYPPVWFCSMVYLLREMGAFRLPRMAAPIALLVFMALSIYTPWVLLVIESQRSLFGVRLDEYVPVKEVQFIKENNLPGPIFNDYLIGGYMIWTMYPDYKVFIDPRFAPYDKSLLDDYFNLIDRFMKQKTGLQLLRDKYGFNIALIHMRALALIDWLVNSPEWSMVYFDKVAVVLMHKSVLHTLSPEARAQDVGPQRFKDLDNPEILDNLFNFYQNFGIGMATEIRNTYLRNVSPLYQFKELRMRLMDSLLEEKRQKRHPAGQTGSAETAGNNVKEK